jgi:hypothetical protein
LEHDIMPKVIVLFYGAESPASSLAESAAHGAGHVRFTEVDIRSGGPHEADTRHARKRLGGVEDLADYAGVIIASPAAGEIPAELDRLLAEAEVLPPATFTNVVFGVAGGENTVLLGRVARLGGIIVSEPRGKTDPEATARALGQRVAKVVDWVRHAMGHEAGAGVGHTH